MANEVRTNVVIEGKAKGLDRLAAVSKTLDAGVRSLLGMKKTASESEAGMRKYQKEMAGLEDRLKGVAREQLNVLKAMKGLDKASKDYEGLTKQLKSMEQEERQLARQVQLTTRAYSDQARAVEDAKRRAGSFTQGLLQGAGGTDFIQRGPGMFRQAAGAAIGRAGRRFAGGALSAPFTGMEGITQGLSALPGGGLVAGQIQAAMGLAGNTLASKQAQMDLAPFLGVGGGSARAMSLGEIERQAGLAGAAARGGAVSGAELSVRARKYREDAIQAKASQVAGSTTFSESEGQRLRRERLEVRMGGAAQDVSRERAAREVALGAVEGVGAFMAPALRDILSERATAAAGGRRAELESGRRKELARAQAAFESPLTAGTGFGFDKTEMMQMAGQLGQISGGKVLQEESGRAMIPAAAAAQRAYGVGADVSGAYLMAQRRGGIVGGPAGAQGLTRGISEAFKIGFSDSEMSEYMQQMAEGIMAWKTTGISLDTGSVTEMAQSIARTGVGGVQGARIAQGLQAAGRSMVAGGGPQSSAQMALFQDLFGFKGGSLADLKDAMMRAQEGSLQSDGFDKMMERFTKAAGGDAAGGTLVASNVLQSLGASVSIRDLDMMMKQSRIKKGSGEELTPLEREQVARTTAELEKAAGAAPKSQADIDRAARAVTPGAISRQKGLTNQELAAGGALIPAVQDLSQQAVTMAKTVGTFSPEIQKLTTGVMDAAKGVENFAKTLRKEGFLEAVSNAVVGP